MKYLSMLILCSVFAGCGSPPPEETPGLDGEVVSMSRGAKENATASTGIDAVSEAELGLPFYPGSTPAGSGSATAAGDGSQTIASMRQTKDSVAKVAEFYRGKVVNAETTTSNAGGGNIVGIQGSLPDGAEVTVAIQAAAGQDTMITLSVRRKS